MASSSSSSSSPCAACKFLRRRCTQDCVFAPYFPPDLPQKFANVHKVFGAGNVAKILKDLPPAQREDAVTSLAYEANSRLRDPVYGCFGLISILQNRLRQLHHDLIAARRELASYVTSSSQQGLLLHSRDLAAVAATPTDTPRQQFGHEQQGMMMIGGYEQHPQQQQQFELGFGLNELAGGSLQTNMGSFDLLFQCPHQLQLQLQSPQPLQRQQQPERSMKMEEEDGTGVGRLSS